MEAARNGDMLRYIQRKGALPEPEIKHYFNQLIQAVGHCHSKNICHRFEITLISLFSCFKNLWLNKLNISLIIILN